ncbi:MAG: arsenate reductase (glutaredoxin), partial [Gammaproteobacteria bacterium]
HNPRCSKSRQTLELLRNRGVEPRIVNYLETPPSIDELRDLVAKLGISPRELLRTKEAAHAEAGLDAPDVDDETILAAMHSHPILIERPIVVAGDRARIGRPPESVMEILD